MSIRHNVTVPDKLDELLRRESSIKLKSIAQVIRDALFEHFKDALAEQRNKQKTGNLNN